MTEERAKRKLSAILSADVEGYSHLMRDDEHLTVRTLEGHRGVMAALIQNYRGRVVDAPGDNLMAEFGSVVDAVEAAVDIQKKLELKNTDLPEKRRMRFRIGINLGDVIEEGDRIYGDGINIAARIESLAEAGGICISKNAFEQVKNKLSLGYAYLGEHKVKNIAEPIHVYQVLTAPDAAGKLIGEKRGGLVQKWPGAAIATVAVLVGLFIWQFYHEKLPKIEAASPENMAYPLPEKPSIAVLPFENLSNDPKQDYIVSGITDNITTALTQVPDMFVIAKNSADTYKGKSVKIKQISEELGVRYVLQGSVQKVGEKLRVNVQLIDAIKGLHLWADRYDREFKDIFALQDNITMKILTALQVELTDGESALMFDKGTDNLEAYLKQLKAGELFIRLNQDDNHLAQQMSEEVIALDPQYSVGYVTLGWTHYMDVILGSTEDPEESLAKAEALALKAIELDDSNSGHYSLLSYIYRKRRQFDQSIASAERAVAIAPNHDNFYHLANALNLAGKAEESIPLYKKAIRRDPIPQHYYTGMLTAAYFNAGRYEDALPLMERELDLFKRGKFPKSGPLFGGGTHRRLAANYIMLGEEEKAKLHANELLKINPEFSLKLFEKYLSGIYKNQTDVDRWISALRKAGL